MANTLKFGNGEWYGKKDTILAYNDENYNYKPLPFSFERASSATVVNKAGLIETVGSGEPRIDFLGNTKGALKLEPQRSNLIQYSEDFSNTYWSPNSNALRSLSSNLSPDGTANAYRVEAVTGTQVGYVGTTTIGTTVTHSIWVRRISGSTTFNMVDVNNNSTSVNITSDWQRFSLTSTATSTNLRSYFKTTALGDVVEIYGAQIEAGSYATSYIPTQGSTVTRLADVCTNGGNEQVFNSTEGTLYAEISALNSTSLSSKYISISDGTYNNRASILFSTGSTNQIRTFLRVGGAVQIDVSNSVNNVTDFNKIAFSYKENDFKVYINGSLASSDTNGSVWSANTITKLSFSEINSSVNKFEGKTKDVRIFTTALTDSELKQLTTI